MIQVVLKRLSNFGAASALAAVVSLCMPVLAHAQMQRAMGIDASGFGQPVPAFAVTVPQGWQTRGGVQWNIRDTCNPYGYDFSWAAISPDERYGVAILPSVRWVSQPSNGVRQCPVLQVSSARDLISAIVARMVPNAKLLDYRQRADYLKETGLQPSRYDLGSGSYMATHVDAGEALYGYVDERGRQMRATLGLVVMVHETFMPGGGVMADMRHFQGQSLPAWLAFAPDGELNMSMSEQMRQSIEINPSWQQQITKHQSKINSDNRRTQQNISRINRETNEFTSRLSREAFDNRMKAMDKAGEDFSNMMLERDVWRDTDGTKLNAPSGGANMWRLDNGDYVSTDDYNFNPLQSTGQFGTQLQRWE